MKDAWLGTRPSASSAPTVVCSTVSTSESRFSSSTPRPASVNTMVTTGPPATEPVVYAVAGVAQSEAVYTV